LPTCNYQLSPAAYQHFTHAVETMGEAYAQPLSQAAKDFLHRQATTAASLVAALDPTTAAEVRDWLLQEFDSFDLSPDLLRTIDPEVLEFFLSLTIEFEQHFCGNDWPINTAVAYILLHAMRASAFNSRLIGVTPIPLWQSDTATPEMTLCLQVLQRAAHTSAIAIDSIDSAPPNSAPTTPAQQQARFLEVFTYGALLGDLMGIANFNPPGSAAIDRPGILARRRWDWPNYPKL
jgi:hypothetical protein